MWALACVFIVVFGVLHGWIRSEMPWMQFLILRGGFFYCRLWHRWSGRRAPFPRQGPAIVVANHTCSADPTFLLAACDRTLAFLVSREHFFTLPWFCRAILLYCRCVPVTRSGPDPGALRRGLRRLAEGDIVCLFPEGNLSGVARKRLRMPKPGAALLALVSRAPVYPVYIAGGPRTDRLLESWLLPTTRSVRVHFGPPIDLSAYYDRPRTRPVIEEVARVIMKKVEELARKSTDTGRTEP